MGEMNKNREPEKNAIDIARDAGQIDIARDAGQIDIARDAGQIDIARGGGKYERGDSLAQVKASLEFIEQATADDGARSRLENAAGHEEVIRLAKESGYEISRESLAEAM